MSDAATLASPDAAARDGLYLYAILDAPAPARFEAAAIGGRGDPVTTLAAGRLAAVVSASPRVEYENSRRNMMAHTRVLEEAMAGRTLLPVCFGTVAADAAAVTETLLGGRRDELLQLMEQMRGRHELGLKVSWRDDAVFEEVMAANPALRRLRDALVGQPPERTHFERIRLGEEIGKALDRLRLDDEQRVLDRIRGHVHKTRLNKPIGDRMVLNAALLVDAGEEPALDAAVRAMDADWGDRLTFKYVGPVPPYNFVSITLRW